MSPGSNVVSTALNSASYQFNGKMRRCESCDRSFVDEKALKQHLQNSPAGLHAQCPPCDKTFVSSDALDQHLRDSAAHRLGVAKRAAHKNPARRPDPAETRISFMFPNLHEAVVDTLSQSMTKLRFRDNVHEIAEHEYSTYVMAKFTCNNHGRVPRVWSSKKVTILIRGYGRGEYNAVVYNQRCEKCENLGRIDLDETSYVDRVSYRLKKWAGVQVERQDFIGRTGPPHLEEFCEGCKAGYCQRNRLQSAEF